MPSRNLLQPPNTDLCAPVLLHPRHKDKPPTYSVLVAHETITQDAVKRPTGPDWLHQKAILSKRSVCVL